MRSEPELGFERLVEGSQGGLGAGFADRGQMGVDDGGVERFVAEILADLAEGHALLEQVRGIAVPQAVGGGGAIHRTGSTGEAVSHLH